jgi:hypothetical protein
MLDWFVLTGSVYARKNLVRVEAFVAQWTPGALTMSVHRARRAKPSAMAIASTSPPTRPIVGRAAWRVAPLIHAWVVAARHRQAKTGN